MNIRFYIKIIVGLLIVKFAFAEVIDVDDQEMIKLSNLNIPIVDVRRSSEWDQTGVIPNSILLTFFDEEGNYNFDEWYEKLQLEINLTDPSKAVNKQLIARSRILKPFFWTPKL